MTTTTIIAEMAWAHDGQLEKALRIMRGAAEAGADVISVHLTSLPDYMVPQYGNGTGKVSAGREHLEVYRYLQDINLSNEDWMTFAKEARNANIQLCVMPNDMPSLQFAATELKPDMLVISPAAFVELDFVEAIAGLKLPTLLRIGGATLGEIQTVVEIFRRQEHSEVVLLHGFQNYPTELRETQIRQLTGLQAMFGCPVGLADHIDGADPLAQIIPLLSIALGASYIEKHITWDRAEKGEDFESALDPAAFKQFVTYVRAAEAALGRPEFAALSDATLRYRSISRKKIVAKQNLKAGERLKREDLICKRSDVGLSADRLPDLLGRSLSRELSKDDAVLLEDCV